MTTRQSREQADILTVLAAEFRNGKSISRRHLDLLTTAHKILSEMIVDHGTQADVQNITTAIGNAVTAKTLSGKRSETGRLQQEVAEMRRNTPKRPATAEEVAWSLLRLRGRG